MGIVPKSDSRRRQCADRRVRRDRMWGQPPRLSVEPSSTAFWLMFSEPQALRPPTAENGCRYMVRRVTYFASATFSLSSL